jgi:hypothetical protein
MVQHSSPTGRYFWNTVDDLVKTNILQAGNKAGDVIELVESSYCRYRWNPNLTKDIEDYE